MKFRKVFIKENENQHQIVEISKIIFKGKQHIDWDAVEKYALRYGGETYRIAIDGELIYVDNRFADEFANSIDTKRLRGMLAKAKANAVQGIKALLECSDNPRYIPNYEKNMSKMPSLAGIDMIVGFLYQCMKKKELFVIMFLK